MHYQVAEEHGFTEMADFQILHTHYFSDGICCPDRNPVTYI